MEWLERGFRSTCFRKRSSSAPYDGSREGRVASELRPAWATGILSRTQRQVDGKSWGLDFPAHGPPVRLFVGCREQTGQS